MKRIIGVSLLSTMLLLGQPLMAFADTTGPRIINFEDLETIVIEQSIGAEMNENERLKAYVDLSGLKRDIRDLEDELEDINNQRDEMRDAGADASFIAQLGSGKRALLEALKQLERTEVDIPTYKAMFDLTASVQNDSLIRTAEGIFIGYNQLELRSSTISLNIETLQDKLAIMELQASLGWVSRTSMNELRTALVDAQTQLESVKFQQASLERQLKNLLNEQEIDLVIGSIPDEDQDSISAEEDTVSEDEDSISQDDDSISEDEDTDLEKAQKNNYTIKLLEQQIIMAQATLDRAKKDNGMSSKQYKKASYELENYNLKLTQEKVNLKAAYDTMLDDIAKIESSLRLAELTLEDKKVAFSEAQLKFSLGLISKLDMDNVSTAYESQENTLKATQIELFNAKTNYAWFLRGMPRA